jgi:cardiolipin synthase
MTIDDAWSLIGSANWDTRSFRLNFELNVEIQDEAFARSSIEANAVPAGR